MTKEQQEHTKSQIMRLYARFVVDIANITVRVPDIHNPIEGVNKECVTQISLKSGGKIMATKRNGRTSNAIHQSVTAGRAMLRRRLGKGKPQLAIGS